MFVVNSRILFAGFLMVPLANLTFASCYWLVNFFLAVRESLDLSLESLSTPDFFVPFFVFNFSRLLCCSF